VTAPRDVSGLLRAYLVTDRHNYGGRTVVETVVAAVAGGVTAVQLRDPHASGRELCRIGESLLEVLEGTGVPLIVDDRLDVALAIGAQGVHLGQTDLPVPAARRIAGPELVIGLSTTNADQVVDALALPAGTVDYLGVGPIWATTTKADAKAPIGIAGLAASLAAASSGRRRLPCVAIGGISLERAPEVAATGAGAAVVSAISGAPDPQAASARLARIMGRGPTESGALPSDPADPPPSGQHSGPPRASTPR
jgi:thiamine-phosphate pyrophosphorylase